MIDNLESERLILEPISLKHVSTAYLSWLNDEDTIKYLVTKKGNTLKSLSNYIERHLEKKTVMYAIIIKENKAHIGNIKIDPINELDMSGELGILVGDKNSWGKGYGRESCSLIMQHCFKNLHLTQINLGVDLNNKKAIKLYEKLGFKKYNFKSNRNKNNIRMFHRYG